MRYKNAVFGLTQGMAGQVPDRRMPNSRCGTSSRTWDGLVSSCPQLGSHRDTIEEEPPDGPVDRRIRAPTPQRRATQPLAFRRWVGNRRLPEFGVSSGSAILPFRLG